MKAIVFVDVQKDFIDGALKNESAIAVVPKIVELANQCVHDDECKIYATRDTHMKTIYADIHRLDGTLCKDVPWNGYLETLEGKKLPVEHCIKGTEGWMIDNRLMDVFFAGYAKDETGVEDAEHPIYNCTFINKPTFGSFDLVNVIAEDFESKKLDEIVLCGFVSSICVAANAIILRAKFPNVKITVMKDLCAGITDEDHIAAMKVLEMQQIEIK